MSKIGQIVQEIEEMIYMAIPNEEIAKTLNVPLGWVEDVYKSFAQEEGWL